MMGYLVGDRAGEQIALGCIEFKCGSCPGLSGNIG
jgi:hypothetical protein